MYARATSSKVNPRQMEQALRIFRYTLDLAREQPGFKGALFLSDRRSGRGMSISLWDTEADLERFEASQDYRRLSRSAASLLSEPSKTEEYEVTAPAEAWEEGLEVLAKERGLAVEKSVRRPGARSQPGPEWYYG